LKKLKVLVDAYNLKLPKGSGIKYHTQKIIELFSNKEDIDISLMFDYPLSGYDKTLEAEFYFQIRAYKDSDKLSKLQLLRLLLSLGIKRDNINLNKISSVVLKDDNYLLNYPIINAPNIYLKANIYNKLDLSLNINLEQKFDIFHATYPLNLNIKNTKKITTIHDLIPLELPYVSLDNKKDFYNLIKRSIEKSDKIITISETSKKDLLKWYDIDEDKIINTYQSYTLPSITDYHNDQNNLQKFKLEKGKYLLFVGSIEPKKNIKRLIEAYRKVDTNTKLVIVGKKAWMWKEELQFLDTSRMKLLDYVSRDDLILLFSHASAFIFPSLYEGFGLPPLEAMACNCPVVTADVSSLPEVCGDAAIYCDPYSIESISNAIDKILNITAEERQQMIEKGRKRVEFFNERDYKKKLVDVYQSVL